MVVTYAVVGKIVAMVKIRKQSIREQMMNNNCAELPDDKIRRTRKERKVHIFSAGVSKLYNKMKTFFEFPNWNFISDL